MYKKIQTSKSNNLIQEEGLNVNGFSFQQKRILLFLRHLKM